MEELEKSERSTESKTLSSKEERERSWMEFEKFYKQLLVGCGAVLLIGIVVAILVSAPVGAAIFAAGCGLYLFFTRDELKRRLGLEYKRTLEGWAVAPVASMKTEILWIPERLMGLPVAELLASEESECQSIQELCLPKSICRIEAEAFCQLPNLKRLCYHGTEEQWEQVEKPVLPSCCELVFSDHETNI